MPRVDARSHSHEREEPDGARVLRGGATRRIGLRARGGAPRADSRRARSSEGHSEEEAMTHTRSSTTKAGAPTDLDAALAAMPAEALREVVHEVLLELDGRARARVVGSIIARVARAGKG